MNNLRNDDSAIYNRMEYFTNCTKIDTQNTYIEIFDFGRLN